MDLSQLDTTIKASDGAEMVLRHPISNEPTDVRLILKGSEAMDVKAAFSRFRRIMDDTKKSDAEKERAANNVIIKCIINIKNASYAGKPLTNSLADIELFVAKFSWASDQIFAFIGDLENFLPDSNDN